MTHNLIASIQHFVELSTAELVERIATSLELCSHWDSFLKLPHIPSTKLNALLDEIMQTANEVGRSPAEVAFSLRTASAVELHHRQGSQLELVMSGPNFPPFEMRRTDEVLMQMIQNAQKRLTLISFALYRVDRLTKALTEAMRRGVEICMYVESATLPIGSIRMLYGEALAAQMEVYVWSEAYRPESSSGQLGRLHAKATIVDSEELFISSANLTEHAMSLNIELGVLIRGTDYARKIEQLFDTYRARGLFERISDKI